MYIDLSWKVWLLVLIFGLPILVSGLGFFFYLVFAVEEWATKIELDPPSQPKPKIKNGRIDPLGPPITPKPDIKPGYQSPPPGPSQIRKYEAATRADYDACDHDWKLDRLQPIPACGEEFYSCARCGWCQIRPVKEVAK